MQPKRMVSMNSKTVAVHDRTNMVRSIAKQRLLGGRFSKCTSIWTLAVVMAVAGVATVDARSVGSGADQTRRTLLPMSTIDADRSETDVVARKIRVALSSGHRTSESRSRDAARNPLETLQFLGWRPGMQVVEVWPGGGWYTDVLGPLTRDNGALFAAGFGATAPDMADWRIRSHQSLADHLADHPEALGHVVLTELMPPKRTAMVPPGSADMVLVFRNVHSFMRADVADAMFEAIARGLKPGGVLGVVQHRAAPGTELAAMRETGYVTESHVIALAASAGLLLEASSEINANPKDTRDHPNGVWTLPPTLRACNAMEDDMARKECEAHYRGIGESDRMTLRFRKPR